MSAEKEIERGTERETAMAQVAAWREKHKSTLGDRQGILCGSTDTAFETTIRLYFYLEEKNGQPNGATMVSSFQWILRAETGEELKISPHENPKKIRDFFTPFVMSTVTVPHLKTIDAAIDVSPGCGVRLDVPMARLPHLLEMLHCEVSVVSMTPAKPKSILSSSTSSLFSKISTTATGEDLIKLFEARKEPATHYLSLIAHWGNRMGSSLKVAVNASTTVAHEAIVESQDHGGGVCGLYFILSQDHELIEEGRSVTSCLTLTRLLHNGESLSISSQSSEAEIKTFFSQVKSHGTEVDVRDESLGRVVYVPVSFERLLPFLDSLTGQASLGSALTLEHIASEEPSTSTTFGHSSGGVS